MRRKWLFLLLIVSVLILPQMTSAHRPERSSEQPITITTGASASAMAAAMDIPPGDIVSATVTGDAVAYAVSDSVLAGFPTKNSSYVILASGRADSADDPDTNNSEVYNVPVFDDLSFDLATAVLTGGEEGARLTVVLTPPMGMNQLAIDFAFFTEDWPDWIGTPGYNDVFVAEIGAEPFTSQLVLSGGAYNSPANFAEDAMGNPVSVNFSIGFNPMIPNPNTGTTYDGTTGTLAATGCLPAMLPGNAVLILTLIDAGDDIIDSAVFIDNFRWSNSPMCSGGVGIPTATPTNTPPGPIALMASAACVNQNLAVTISAGDGPFNITATAGVNTPVFGVGTGTTTINGPEKWDNVTVSETSGNLQVLNLGQFKCRSDQRPVPLTPAHGSHTTNAFPTFSWTAISPASNYRVFVFDNASVASRTVDIRENSGGPTSMTLSVPLPNKRLFWRVRGRQNRLWSLWSVRFTVFKDPVMPLSVTTPVPTFEMLPSHESTAAPTFPPPPNSR